MKPFTKNEYIITGVIFFLVIVITLLNLRVAIRRSRDVQRRADMGVIANVLEKYNEDFGYFPPAEDGKLKACKAENFDEVVADIKDDPVFDRKKLFTGFRVCSWGEDELRDPFDSEYEPYLKVIPQDPSEEDGILYTYFSNENLFQIYAHLEGGNTEESYDQGIVGRNIKCGDRVCNFGKSYADIPLDKSIEEYEMELEMLRRTR